MGGDWMKKGELDNLDFFSMILAGCIHDFEHPGFNNLFLINSKHKFAIWYNDLSVLESHHVAASYRLLSKRNFNIFINCSIEVKKDIWKWVVNMVLATDMSKHFAELGKFKSRVAVSNFDPSGEDKMDCMNMAIHMADISNPSKAWHISFNWIEILFEEFFAQGDEEWKLGLPISDLMDWT